jgi:hypothetical protein
MTSTAPQTSLGARLALAVGSVALTWLALELPGQLELVRYHHLGGASSLFLAAEPWRNPTLVTDADRIFKRVGGTHLTGETPGDMAVWLGFETTPHPYDALYDAAGFRNRSDSREAEIAVIGDSFVEAPLVADEDLLAEQLGRALGTRGATFGHLGYGPQQELDVLRDEVLPHPRQWIVWAFFEGNDLGDFAAYENQIARWPLARAWKRSLAYALLTRVSDTGSDVNAKARERMRARLVRVAAPNAGAAAVEVLLNPSDAAWDERRAATLERAADVIAQAKRESEAKGARFVAAFVPTKWRVYQDADGTPRAKDDPFPQKFLAACAERRIIAVDLAPALRAAAGERLVYVPDDAHWNASGIGVAAREIAAAIRAQTGR